MGSQAASTADISGTADAPDPSDTTWYAGSQQALVAKLTFPGMNY